MLKTIIFDLGNVIVPFDFLRGYTAMAEHCRFAPQEIRERISATGLVPVFESGKIEPPEFFQRISETLELSIDEQEFRRIWSIIFLKPTLIPDSLVIKLREQYRVLLLSNTNAFHFEMVWEHYPILRHFDDYVLSYKVGAMKPDPLIYETAVKLAGCAAEECFFTDDVPAYVEGARGHGIDAVQFTGYERLVEELGRRGVGV
ncbi:MAG: HAD family phosphatase [Acidobacteria bacterium]|nr:HAD family phosphatase [Acidobacteriota bacterium]